MPLPVTRSAIRSSPRSIAPREVAARSDRPSAESPQGGSLSSLSSSPSNASSRSRRFSGFAMAYSWVSFWRRRSRRSRRPRLTTTSAPRHSRSASSAPASRLPGARHFEQVEPENRLVARTLERAWGEKLAALRRAESDLAAQQARRPAALTEEEISWVERAEADVRAIFDAPTTHGANASSLCARSSPRSPSPSTITSAPRTWRSCGRAERRPHLPWHCARPISEVVSGPYGSPRTSYLLGIPLPGTGFLGRGWSAAARCASLSRDVPMRLTFDVAELKAVPGGTVVFPFSVVNDSADIESYDYQLEIDDERFRPEWVEVYAPSPLEPATRAPGRCEIELPERKAIPAGAYRLRLVGVGRESRLAVPAEFVVVVDSKAAPSISRYGFISGTKKGGTLKLIRQSSRLKRPRVRSSSG